MKCTLIFAFLILRGDKIKALFEAQLAKPLCWGSRHHLWSAIKMRMTCAATLKHSSFDCTWKRMSMGHNHHAFPAAGLEVFLPAQPDALLRRLLRDEFLMHRKQQRWGTLGPT